MRKKTEIPVRTQDEIDAEKKVSAIESKMPDDPLSKEKGPLAKPFADLEKAKHNLGVNQAIYDQAVINHGQARMQEERSNNPAAMLRVRERDALRKTESTGGVMGAMWRLSIKMYYGAARLLTGSDENAQQRADQNALNTKGLMEAALVNLETAQSDCSKAEQNYISENKKISDSPLLKEYQKIKGEYETAKRDAASLNTTVDAKKEKISKASQGLLASIAIDPDSNKHRIKLDVLNDMMAFLKTPTTETREKFEQSASNFKHRPRTMAEQARDYLGTSEHSRILKNITECQSLFGNTLETNKPATSLQENKSQQAGLNLSTPTPPSEPPKFKR